jgi:phosphoribosylpyrophosphate synthetase
MELGQIKIKRFADGEIYVQVQVRLHGRGSVHGLGNTMRAVALPPPRQL